MFRKIILFLFLLTVLSLAQSNLTEPVPLRTNLLAHSELLPENLQLSTNDTISQIIFNPARALNFDKSFFFINYLPQGFYDSAAVNPEILNKRNGINNGYSPSYSSLNSNLYTPSFSVVTLFNYLDRKWLFQLDYELERFDADEGEDLFNDPVNKSLYKYSSSNYHNLNSTTAKLSYIGNSKFLGDYSIGLYYRGSNTHDNSFNENQYYNYSNIGTYVSETTTRDGNSIARQNIRKYSMGLEFTRKSVLWDYRGRFNVQTGKIDFLNNHRAYYQIIDSSVVNFIWNVTNSTTLRSTNNKYDIDPYTLSLENYYSRQVKIITPEDNIYITANIYFADGNIKLSQENKNNYLNDDTTIIKESTLNYTNKLNDWGLNIAGGYVFKKSYSDLFILSGLNVNFGYSKYTDILCSSPFTSSGNLSYTNYNIKNYAFSLMLPVYLKFAATELLSVIGGINFLYSFAETRYTIGSQIEIFPDVNYITPSVGNLQQNWTSLNLYSENFVGLELKHPSGFLGQISFNRNFAATSYWNLSFGYVF